MKKTSVYIFIDALGWETASKCDFMGGTLPYRTPVKPQFGYASGAIPTLLTGTPPASHGHFCPYFFNPKDSPFKAFKYLKFLFGAGLYPKCLFNSKHARKYAEKIVRAVKGYDGFFKLYSVPYDKLRYFDYCQKRDIFTANGLAPAKNLADILCESGIRHFISDWRKPVPEIISEAKSSISGGDVDFAFITLPGLDRFTRYVAEDDKAVADEIAKYEAAVLEIMSALEKSQNAFKLSVVSSHGVIPCIKTVDIMKKISSLGLKFGRDYAAFYEPSMAVFWYLNGESRQKIRSALSGSGSFGGRFLGDPEKIEFGIRFRGAELDNAKFGDDIFLMEEGAQIEPNFRARKASRRLRGFYPDSPASMAALLSTDKPPFEAREFCDIFKLMRRDIDSIKNGH